MRTKSVPQTSGGGFFARKNHNTPTNITKFGHDSRRGIWYTESKNIMEGIVFMNSIRPEHPDPQSRRDRWLSLNGTWDFSFDSPDFDRKITVPFAWGTVLSGISEVRRGTAWYRRTASFDCGGGRLFLHIGAVEFECDIFVNRTYIGHYFSGFVPVCAEITSAWDSQSENTLCIRVSDPGAPYQPSGKSYASRSGIWQSVWLEARPQTYINRFQIETRCSGTVTIRAAFGGPAHGTLHAAFGGTTASSDGDTVVLHIGHPQLWTPDHPYLYEGTLSLTTPDGVDTVHTYFGIREISDARVDDLPRKYITLNGQPVFLNGCLDQSCTLSGFTQPTDADLRTEVQQMKALGLNSFRIHLKPEDPRKLYWADRLGMLVIQDMPIVGHGENPIGRWFYEFTMRAVMQRDRNHPSIFMWVLFNETWGLYVPSAAPDGTKSKVYPPDTQAWVVQCCRTAKLLDPTRLIDDNSVHDDDRNHTVTDVNSWHLYANGYERMKAGIEKFVSNSAPGSTFNFVGGAYTCPDVPVLNCECGNYWDFAVDGTLGVAGDSDISGPYKYMVNEFRLHDEMCGFVFTEFRDVPNEFNGYYRIDGTPKTFGYDAFVPGMSIRDLHAADFLATDCAPMQSAVPGESVTIPLVISSFSARHHGRRMRIRYELADETGAVFSEGIRACTYTRYGCTPLDPLTLTLPESDGLAVVRLYLLDADGACVMRNFVVYNVHGDRPVLPLRISAAEGFRRISDCQNGCKHSFIGSGTVRMTVNRADIPGYTDGCPIAFRMEASAKPELTKDRESIGWAPDTIGLFTDPGRNPNSYPQTDAVCTPAAVTVRIDDRFQKTFSLPDGPADSRGCLSWFSQPPHRSEDAGSYGYRCEWTLSADEARSLPDRFEIVLESSTGFSLYERESGRYAIGTELWVPETQHTLASSV